MERTLRKSFLHGERVTAELVEENRAPLVIGGSGTLGWAVVARLLAAGHEVRVLRT